MSSCLSIDHRNVSDTTVHITALVNTRLYIVDGDGIWHSTELFTHIAILSVASLLM